VEGSLGSLVASPHHTVYTCHAEISNQLLIIISHSFFVSFQQFTLVLTIFLPLCSQIHYTAARVFLASFHCQADTIPTSRSITRPHKNHLLLSYRISPYIIYLYLSCITDSLFILTMYCQCNVPDPSCRPSWTMLGIEPTVAWAPTHQCCGGSMLSLFRLCIAPGWLA
jgi:hypothetical protein